MYALIFVSCITGTINCTTHSEYFKNEVLCMRKNNEYILKGSCVRVHAELKIEPRLKGQK